MRARGDCQVEMSLKRDPGAFPFPFSLFGILPLLPSCYPALAGFIGNIFQETPAWQAAGYFAQGIPGGEELGKLPASLLFS